MERKRINESAYFIWRDFSEFEISKQAVAVTDIRKAKTFNSTTKPCVLGFRSFTTPKANTQPITFSVASISRRVRNRWRARTFAWNGVDRGLVICGLKKNTAEAAFIASMCKDTLNVRLVNCSAAEHLLADSKHLLDLPTLYRWLIISFYAF